MRDLLTITAGAFGVLLSVALVIGLLVFGPLVLVWAINVLFGTETAYNFTTWVASVFLWSLFTGAFQVTR